MSMQSNGYIYRASLQSTCLQQKYSFNTSIFGYKTTRPSNDGNGPERGESGKWRDQWNTKDAVKVETTVVSILLVWPVISHYQLSQNQKKTVHIPFSSSKEIAALM